ncbi:MAG: ABC transporter substrate-binding protein, partial [Tatlockia sp.]|nr:ABC transporter substrate-binding protein [Tatlockia sp.]
MFAIFSLMRRWLVGLLTVVIAIALIGCNPNDFKSQAAQVTQLVDTIVGEPKTFNYALSSESPNVFPLIYEGLITENGVTAEIEPALAETWQISDDKKQIVFTLRQGLKWSDGEPLTADDVVFSFNDIYLNPDIPTSTRDGLQIGESKALPKVRKISTRQVEFIVPEPFAPLLRSAGGTPILPKHILAKTITTKDKEGKPQFLSTWGTDTDPKKVISNGPYKLDAYNTSQRVVFGRNPYYWRKDKQGNPQPY